MSARVDAVVFPERIQAASDELGIEMPATGAEVGRPVGVVYQGWAGLFEGWMRTHRIGYMASGLREVSVAGLGVTGDPGVIQEGHGFLYPALRCSRAFICFTAAVANLLSRSLFLLLSQRLRWDFMGSSPSPLAERAAGEGRKRGLLFPEEDGIREHGGDVPNL